MKFGNWLVVSYGLAISSGVGFAQGPALPAITSGAMVEPWTYRAGLSPGGWISVYGLDLAVKEEYWQPVNGQPLATTLGGTTVRINGVPAVLSYVSRNMINLLIPGQVPVGDVTVTVDRSGATSAAVFGQVRRVNPAIYCLPMIGAPPVKFQVTALVAGSNQLVGSALTDSRVIRGARPGELIDLYATGMGRTIGEFPTDRLFTGTYALADSFDVELGQSKITPEFVGLVSPGLYLVRFRIPASLTAQEVAIRLVSGDLRSADNVYLTLDPVQVNLESLVMRPATITGTETSTGTITLTGPAPSQGVDVQLRLSTSSTVTPIRIAAGQRTGAFTITGVPGTIARTITVTAAWNGTERSANLTILPPAPVAPLRGCEVRISANMTLEGRPVTTTMIVSVPDLSPGAWVSNSDTLTSGVIIYANFDTASLSGNTVTFSNVVGSFTNIRGSGSGVMLSGKLALTASSASIGTNVTGTFEFSTAAKSYSTNYTGRIFTSECVR